MKVGPVVKRDVMKASVMLEHEVKYAVILAFDVRVERDAQEMADSLGVKIFQVSFPERPPLAWTPKRLKLIGLEVDKYG